MRAGCSTALDAIVVVGVIEYMVINTVPQDTLAPCIGSLNHDLLVRVDRSLAVFLGIV